MKRKEMMKELGFLKDFCIEMQKWSNSDGWKKGAVALVTAINILEDYENDIEHIKDLVTYLFIFVGLLVTLALIIACRM